jgi:acetyl-CoA carboxylase biotin carboxyl carrier protein
MIFRRKFTVDPELVRELSKLLEETGLGEIEIERDGTRVRVAREAKAPTESPRPGAAAARPAPSAAEPVEDYSKHPGVVLSPMVGTAYRATEPGGKPLCEIGSKVAAGQALLVVEAMKTMNTIPAPRAGTVAKLLVEDGQPVEFGEPLLILE